MAILVGSAQAKNLTQFITNINALIGPLLSNNIRAVQFYPGVTLSKLGDDLQFSITYDTTGTVIATPYQVNVFSGNTLAIATAAAQTFITANSTFFFSSIYTLVNNPGTSRVASATVCIIYNTSSANGSANWQAGGTGGSGGGTIGGSISANQVAVGTGVNAIGGSANFTFNALTGLVENTTTTSNVFEATGSVAAFAEINIQNTLANANASSDVVATADNGTPSTHYVDMGINSSLGGTAPFLNANAAYLYSTDVELDIGAIGANGVTNVYSGAIPSLVTSFSVNHGISTNRTATLVSGCEFFGKDAGNTTATGQNNTALGNGAGQAISNGSANVYAGYLAGASGTSASSSVAIGSQALTTNVTTSSTVAVGNGAAQFGINNGGGVFIGQSAGIFMQNLNNVAVGSGALSGSITVSSNTGGNNVAVGTNALVSTTSGGSNTAVGNSALGNFLAVSNQVAVGFQALQGSGTPGSNTGTLNTAVGYQALAVMTSASRTVAVGYLAATAVTTSPDNTAIGASALTALTIGSGLNTAVGSSAGAGITSGSTNTLVGYQAGVNITIGTGNTFIGSSAGLRMFNGGSNIAIGNAALIGTSTVASNTGTKMIVIGTSSVQQNTSAGTTVVIGCSSGANLTTGTNNVMIGDSVGSSVVGGVGNILLGAGTSADTDTSNTFMAGSTAAPISSVWFGNGQTNASPQAVVFNATGGNGSNVAGAALTIAGGISTGTGAGGAVTIQTAPVGTTGSSANTLTTRLTVGGDGGVKWTGIATTSAPATSGANNGTIYYDSTLQQFLASTNNGAYAALGGGGGGSITSTVGTVSTITGTTTLTSANINTLYLVSGTTADYTINLPTTGLSTGNIISFSMVNALTKLVTINAGTKSIDGATTRVMWANEYATLMYDGTNWTKIAGRTIPMACELFGGGSTNVTDSTLTTITLSGTPSFNVGSMADSGNSRVIVRRAGNYNVSGAFNLATHTAGVTRLNCYFLKNGGTFFAIESSQPSTSADSGIGFNRPMALAAADTLLMQAYQANAGAATLATVNDGSRDPFLCIVEIPQW